MFNLSGCLQEECINRKDDLMGDNGKEFLSDELKEAKRKKFNEDPDQFVDMDELIIAVKRGDGNILQTFINTVTRTELEIALMRLTHQCFGVFNAMSHAQQQAQIIKPKGSIIDFVRKRR